MTETALLLLPQGGNEVCTSSRLWQGRRHPWNYDMALVLAAKIWRPAVELATKLRYVCRPNLARCQPGFQWYLTHVATERLHSQEFCEENWQFSVFNTGYSLSILLQATGVTLIHTSLHYMPIKLSPLFKPMTCSSKQDRYPQKDTFLPGESKPSTGGRLLFWNRSLNKSWTS